MNLLNTAMLMIKLSFFSIVLISTNAVAFTSHTPDTILQASDTVGSVISMSVQFKRISLKTYLSTNDTAPSAVFPKNSELSITGNDVATGLKEIYVALDNASELLYKVPLRLTARGRHTVRARAVDYAGNETIFSIDLIIKE